MYAAARVNFLTDPRNDPHMTAEEIAAGFGVSPATMYFKKPSGSRRPRINPFDPDFTIASRLEDNPIVWFLKVNGVMMDIRDAPRGAPVVAFENGLIPYIPADQDDAE